MSRKRVWHRLQFDFSLPGKFNSDIDYKALAKILCPNLKKSCLYIYIDGVSVWKEE